LFPFLIKRAQDLGYRVTFGEFWRPDFTAKHYEKIGKGSKNSLHRVRLAGDLNLFDRWGVYLTKTEDYRELGEYWEGLSYTTTENERVECTWGGRFNDGNHFSIEHNGVK